MSHQIDFLPIAASAGANVETQATFAGSGFQLNGFQVGIADPTTMNKALRQASMMTTALANVIANELNIDLFDDGDLNALITKLTNALMQAANNARRTIVTVAYSLTPQFDAGQGDTFEIVLTGDVTSSTLVGVSPGQTLRWIIKQDGSGNHAFTPPPGVQMAAINPTANSTSSQRFFADAASIVYPDGPMVSQ